MSVCEPFTLQAPDGGVLWGELTLPESSTPLPVVVFCHGFKGFFGWGFHPPLADFLAGRDLAVVRFNFTGAGMRPGDERVSDPAAFRKDTYSREAAELRAVLAALPDLAPGRLDPDRLGLFGHSRGGGIALLAAAHPVWRERVRALVTWAAIGRCDRFTPEEKAAWRARGELPVVNSRTGQQLAMGRELLDDLEANAAALDLTAAAARRAAPWLLLHGERDEAVPVAEAHELAIAAMPPFEADTLAQADHTFGARHPFAGPTPELTQAFDATGAWFRRWLVEG